jgi:hypothetical protein
MKGFYLVILLAFLTGCAPFDGYIDNSHRWYHNSLNKIEKEKIYKSGGIIKSWNGTNNLGDYTRGNLLIKNGEKRNLFNFIETGKWEERHSGSLGKTIKSNIYDDYGNNLESKMYLLRG